MTKASALPIRQFYLWPTLEKHRKTTRSLQHVQEMVRKKIHLRTVSEDEDIRELIGQWESIFWWLIIQGFQ